MNDQMSRRLGKLEMAHAEDRHLLGVVVYPHHLDEADRADFIAAGAVRLAGRPFIVIPTKALDHARH